MPRGVKGSGKPRVRRQAAQRRSVASDAPPVVVAPADKPVPLDLSGPLKSLDVDRLAGDDLRRYALKAGVVPRDVQGLTEDRLRQNVKLVIQQHFDLIADDS